LRVVVRGFGVLTFNTKTPDNNTQHRDRRQVFESYK
jgi:hypothetical protein